MPIQYCEQVLLLIPGPGCLKYNINKFASTSSGTIPFQHENYTEILVPNGIENWTENLNKIVMETKSKNKWGVKLKFWMTLVGMREELYEDVGLGHLRNEQGGCDTRIEAGDENHFEKNQSQKLGNIYSQISYTSWSTNSPSLRRYHNRSRHSSNLGRKWTCLLRS